MKQIQYWEKRPEIRGEYVAWAGMIRRCRNPNAYYYERYGGRGIKVCKRWEKFKNFLEDMGYKPSPKFTLDRIDNDGDYEPGNCRWVSQQTQCNNRSSNRRIVIHGREMTVSEAIRLKGLPEKRVWNWFYRYPKEKAVRKLEAT